MSGLVSEGKETANRWASWRGPVFRIAANFVPRGVNAKPDRTLSENTTSCQNGIVSQRTNANEAPALVLERDGKAYRVEVRKVERRED